MFDGAGLDSGIDGMFDAAGICLLSARVFLLLLLPLAPGCLAGCGGRMLGIGEGSGAGDGHDATFSGSFAALEMGVGSGGCGPSTLGSETGGAALTLFFWALLRPALFS